MRRALTLCACLGAMVACTPAPAPQALALADGAFVARAPAGYCFDTVASRGRDDFAVAAPCIGLGQAGEAPLSFAIATVQIGPEGSADALSDEQALRDFVVSPAGAELLSGSDDSAAIEVVSAQALTDQVIVLFQDSGPPPMPGVENREWRAFAVRGTRMITVSVRGLSARPPSQAAGFTVLRSVLSGVALAPPPSDPQPNPEPS